ncbi:MAG: 4-vinyl reductase, partial [Desulfamplus sp.]|nr:4-vinyl reductase [Desulfamplus sp.]
GGVMDVAVYRLMQFTLRDVIIQEFDTKTAERIYYRAGELAGKEFCKALLNKNSDLNSFVAQLQELLASLKIGILRIEKSDLEKLHLTMTVAEDLDCSGLPICNENVCTYDEGFIAGILEEYTNTPFEVKEVDCWCSGDRVCRFEAKPAI